MKRQYIFENQYYFVWKYWFTLIARFLQKHGNEFVENNQLYIE